MKRKRKNTKAKSARTREPSRLESLPGELRSKIHYYTVVEETFVEAATLVVAKQTYGESFVEWIPNDEPALSMTCKQFRREALPMYYSENIFEFKINKCVIAKTLRAGIDSASAQLAQHMQRIDGHVHQDLVWNREILGRDIVMKTSEDRTQIECWLLEGGNGHRLKIFQQAEEE